MTHQTPLALTFAALLLAACGGSAPDTTGDAAPAAQAIVVVVSPSEAEVAPDGTLKLGALVTGTANGAVSWQVVEPDGGTVDATGLYTAPATEGTFHVQAISATSTKSAGSSVVRVKKGAAAQVLVAVDPATATVPAGGSRSFTAAVTGTTTRTVTWTIQEGSSCGSVSATGVYTAPNAGATCRVVATSVADATKSGMATVTVTPPPPHVVTVTPGSASVLTGGTYTFGATVTGTTAGESVAVTWSVPAGSGTINASTGVYVAPATAGTYVVTATSVATPSGTATATVTVTAPPPPPPAIAITISPTTATLDACTSRVFTAAVTNSSNTAVNWTVVDAGGGTVTSGTYLAPTTPGTYRVLATSVADPTKTAQATVTVGPERVLSVAVTPGSGTVQANGTLAFARERHHHLRDLRRAVARPGPQPGGTGSRRFALQARSASSFHPSSSTHRPPICRRSG